MSSYIIQASYQHLSQQPFVLGFCFFRKRFAPPAATSTSLLSTKPAWTSMISPASSCISKAVPMLTALTMFRSAVIRHQWLEFHRNFLVIVIFLHIHCLLIMYSFLTKQVCQNHVIITVWALFRKVAWILLSIMRSKTTAELSWRKNR